MLRKMSGLVLFCLFCVSVCGSVRFNVVRVACQARIQLLTKGEVVTNNGKLCFVAASSKCLRPHATKTSSATS